MTDVPVWTNAPTRLDLAVVEQHDLTVPLYLLGDYSGGTYAGSWEAIDGTDAVAFTFDAASFPEALPVDDGEEYTLVTMHATDDDLTVDVGALYRWQVDMDGTPLVGGRMTVLEATP